MQSSAQSAESARVPMATCRSCGGAGVGVFYEALALPVHSNRLHASREEALAQPTGDLRLGLCRRCGFIQNCAHDPSLQDYDQSYEDDQGHSARFDRFATQLARGLVERHDLAGRQVLEIGCGRGEFLLRLLDAGAGSGVGIDPAFRESPVSERAPGRLRFLPELYTRRHANLRGDLVSCRHTLEHIPDVEAFVRMLRGNLGARSGSILYFEVPDTLRILRENAFWDVYFEHCSYFTEASLARLFESCGFEILDLRKGYDDQYLMLEARPSDAPVCPSEREPRTQELIETARRFASGVDRILASWRARLDAFCAQGRRVALWGSGSKAVAFLTSLGVSREVECVVDINPKKQGSFQAGSGHPVLAPPALREIRPDVVIAMNPVYREEIARDLERLGVRAELCCL